MNATQNMCFRHQAGGRENLVQNLVPGGSRGLKNWSLGVGEVILELGGLNKIRSWSQISKKKSKLMKVALNTLRIIKDH